MSLQVKDLESSLHADVNSQASIPLTPVTPDTFRIADPRSHTEDNTIFTSTEGLCVCVSVWVCVFVFVGVGVWVCVTGVSIPFHIAVSDIEMGLAVVVRGISENSKAVQDGLKVGDEIREVNRVKGDLFVIQKETEMIKTISFKK